MTQWHCTLKVDLGLRAAGTALLAISFVCIRPVFHLHAFDPAHWSPGVVVYALTTIGFLSASLGSAMVMVGHHIFDRIEMRCLIFLVWESILQRRYPIERMPRTQRRIEPLGPSNRP